MKQYSIWSNCKFTYGPLLKKKKKIAFCTLTEAVFSVFVPVVGMAVTSMIVGGLERGISIKQLSVMILLAFTGYGVLNMVKAYLEARSWGQYIEVRTEFFIMPPIAKDLSISMEQYEDSKIHELREKANACIWHNLDGLEGFFHDNSDLLKNGLGLVAYSVLCGMMDWKILLMLAGMSAVSVAAGIRVTKYYQKIKDPLAACDMTMRYVNSVVDDVAGGKDIRLFGLGKWIIGKYDDAIKEHRKLTFKKDIREYGSNILDTVLNAVRDLVCYLYLIMQLSRGMRISEFVFFPGLVGGFSGWLGMVSKNLVAVKRDSDMICDLREYLDLNAEDGGEQTCDFADSFEIVFDHVSYRYSGAKEDTIKDVSFRLAPGEKLALVGGNGAGKSTIVKLMSGLYLPTSGTVCVNGISTRELDRKSYYAGQAAIFQEAFQTSYSIGENIALSEQYDKKRVWDALEAAKLAEKVRGLEEQFDTCLGKDIKKNGVQLSGGELQKLLLARVLYREASLVMLDEPTAALDALAEKSIYESYHELLSKPSVLFISHRLASTRFCDRILMLSDGRICEEGTHGELMKKHGKYYEMFQVQSRYYLPYISDVRP